MNKSFLLTITVLLGLCCISTATMSVHKKEELLLLNIFKDWVSKFNKAYGVEEMLVRFSNWQNNYQFVLEQNAKTLGMKLGMNRFADMSPEEFAALYLGLNADGDVLKKAGEVKASAGGLLRSEQLPKSVDWRNEGAVTHVKNQGRCGGCYSFAAAGALEGLYAIKNDTLTSLSVQQVIDCSKDFGNLGCDGGLMTQSFNYTMKYGIEPEKGYAYAAKVDKCKMDEKKVVFKNTGFVEVPQNDSKALKAAVAKQPVAIGIEASSLTVQLFMGGVITADCGASLDHGVLIVGYDTDENGQEYWIVKNSWGPEWGLGGYFHVAIGQQNEGAGMCGVNLLASYPTL